MALRTKRDHEGYLLIDHTNSPGFGDEQAGGLPIGAGQKLEAKTYTCSHCQRVSIVNPARTRARPYCPKCDHYICDRCEIIRVASGGLCRPFKAIIAEFHEKAEKGIL